VAVTRDAAALVKQFPDPRTHLIARAYVGIGRFQMSAETAYVGGILASVEPRRIQVPPELAARLPRQDRTRAMAPFNVSLMYGSRWEPWVANLTPAAASQ
jgi:hypothetical protein